MREIKFRAWNGEKIIDNWFKVTERPEAIIENIKFPPYMSPSLNNSTPLAVMQYTGLKDKNGTEIYEGDVVKGAGKHVGQSTVFYGHGQWQPFSYLGSWCGNDYEVIGNIYENPELLDQPEGVEA